MHFHIEMNMNCNLSLNINININLNINATADTTTTSLSHYGMFSLLTARSVYFGVKSHINLSVGRLCHSQSPYILPIGLRLYVVLLL